jgi:hypothetical protein
MGTYQLRAQAHVPIPIPLFALPTPCYNRSMNAISQSRRAQARHATLSRLCLWLIAGVLLAGCQSSPELNVLNYRLARTLGVYDAPPAGAATGAISGLVLDGTQPVEGAIAVAAEPRGTVHAGRTDAAGRYRIDGLPPGRYVPAAVASGYGETMLLDEAGHPVTLTVVANEVVESPPIQLGKRTIPPLPEDLAAAVQLTQTGSYTATTVFPPDAAAQVLSYEFSYDGATVDTLRVYLPLDMAPDAQLPLLFFSYPGDVDGWQDVSVGFASQGYGLAALSPIGARGLDVDAHAADARIALRLAQEGALTPHIDAAAPVIALGGSFTSASLYRLLLTEPERLAAWVTLGGIADAFGVAEGFYAGEIELPPAYSLVIPGLGQPNFAPLALLRYSPVYSAGDLPPTQIIHTAADRILPIEQAFELAEALQIAGVTVETFFYDDVSHYLQVGEALTPEGEEMFGRVLDFIERYQQPVDPGVESE